MHFCMISRVVKGGALKMLCYYASWVQTPHHANFFCMENQTFFCGIY